MIIMFYMGDSRDEKDPCHGCDIACGGCRFENVHDKDERIEIRESGNLIRDDYGPFGLYKENKINKNK